MVYNNNLPARFSLAGTNSLTAADYRSQRDLLLKKNEHGFADIKRTVGNKAQSYTDTSFNFKYPTFKTPAINADEIYDAVLMNIAQMTANNLKTAVYFHFSNRFGTIVNEYDHEFDRLEELITEYQNLTQAQADISDIAGKLNAEIKRLVNRFSDVNEKEMVLNARLTEIRSRMYKNQLDPNPADRTRPYLPSQPFYKVKKIYEESELWDTFRKMPKMGLLHMHTSASVSPQWIIDTLLEDADMDYAKYGPSYIYLGSDPKKRGKLTFERPDGGAYVKLTRSLVYSDNNGKLGEELPDLLSITSDRVNDVDYIWDEFNTIFSKTGELLENPAFYKDYYIKAFKTLVDDNIEYLELRSGFGKFSGNNNAALFLRLLSEAADEANTYAQELAVPKQFKLRIILCGNRSKSRRFDVLKKMILAAQWANTANYEDLIIGFDVVSEEDRGNSTQRYAEFILNSRIYKILNFYFHDGETSWDFNTNMIDAIMLSERRVGHGFGLYRFPQLTDELAFEANTPVHKPLRINRNGGSTVDLNTYFGDLNAMAANISQRAYLSDDAQCAMFCDEVKKYMADKDFEVTSDCDKKAECNTRSIALEICPISNQMLRYTPDLRLHPANALLHKGVQCVLANDDPQIFGNEGLTYDFISAFLAWDLDLWQIKQLIVNSIVYSAIPRKIGNNDSYYDDIITALNRFNVLWHRFLIEQVKETPDNVDGSFGGYRRFVSSAGYTLDENSTAVDDIYITYIDT
jgi:adenosine deaminase-related growth factor